MTRTYAKLREAVREAGTTFEYVAWKIGVSKSHMCDMLNGRSEPRIGECYAILDVLELPHSDFHLYFPRHAVICPIAGVLFWHVQLRDCPRQ